MPQMMPMSWLLIMMMTCLMNIAMLTTIYFNKQYKLKHNIQTKTINWKWKW